VTRTIASEWLKLSTVFAHKVLVIVALAFPIIVGALLATFGDVASGPDSIEMAEFVTGMMIVSTMLLGVVAAIGLTSEYTHNTLRPTYAATPSRARVLAAKLLVSTAVTLVVASLVAFGCWFITSSIFKSRGGEVSIGDDPVLTVLISGIVLSVIVTWFGFGLGLIIRNSPAAVSILLLWPLLIEGLLILVVGLIGWDGLGKYAPYQAAIVAGTANPDSDALGRPGGHIWFAVVAVALVALGVLLDERRDA
jgi:ABC-2 type transport system permease protein